MSECLFTKWINYSIELLIIAVNESRLSLSFNMKHQDENETSAIHHPAKRKPTGHTVVTQYKKQFVTIRK